MTPAEYSGISHPSRFMTCVYIENFHFFPAFIGWHFLCNFVVPVCRLFSCFEKQLWFLLC